MSESDARGSVGKSFSLLRAFRPTDAAGVGVSELARRADLPKSTAHRLLSTLVEYGAVQRAGDVYRLGTLFSEIDHEESTRHGEFVAETLTPYLAALFDRTRTTVHLGYLVGTDVAYANKLFSVKGVDTPSRIGGRVPAYATGVGKAIMAWDDDTIAAVIARGFSQWTPYTITDPDAFRKELALVRTQGVAYDRQEISLGLSCVAAPVFGRDSKPIAAMSISSPARSFDPSANLHILKQICASASKGYLSAVQHAERETRQG